MDDEELMDLVFEESSKSPLGLDLNSPTIGPGPSPYCHCPAIDLSNHPSGGNGISDNPSCLSTANIRESEMLNYLPSQSTNKNLDQVDQDGQEFVIRLSKYDENFKQRVCKALPPTFDFGSVIALVSTSNKDLVSWPSLETKAKQLVSYPIPIPSELSIPPQRPNTPPTKKRKFQNSVPFTGDIRKMSAAASHRRATAKRTRIHGRFAKRKYTWVNVGQDGRVMTE